MKRCPECDFIYFDSDQVCDLDGAALVAANELPPHQDKTPVRKSGRRMVVIIFGAAGIAILLVAVLVAFARFRQPAEIPARSEQIQQPLAPAVTSLAKPSSTSSPSPQASPSGSPKAHSSNDSSNRAAVSKSPVMTSSSEANDSTHIVIRLSNGSRIDADQVWRTKEGIWYRRSGMVTLLKVNEVKSIDKVTERKK